MGVGKQACSLPDISQPDPLGNTFPFVNADGFCRMCYIDCPKSKVGVSIVAFLVVEQEGSCTAYIALC